MEASLGDSFKTRAVPSRWSNRPTGAFMERTKTGKKEEKSEKKEERSERLKYAHVGMRASRRLMGKTGPRSRDSGAYVKNIVLHPLASERSRESGKEVRVIVSLFKTIKKIMVFRSSQRSFQSKLKFTPFCCCCLCFVW